MTSEQFQSLEKYFKKDSESLIKINSLVETLTGTIKEFGFGFILTSRDLIELAKEMVRRDYGQT